MELHSNKKTKNKQTNVNLHVLIYSNVRILKSNLIIKVMSIFSKMSQNIVINHYINSIATEQSRL